MGLHVLHRRHLGIGAPRDLRYRLRTRELTSSGAVARREEPRGHPRLRATASATGRVLALPPHPHPDDAVPAPADVRPA